MSRGKRQRTPLSDVTGGRVLPPLLADALVRAGRFDETGLPPLPPLEPKQALDADGRERGRTDGFADKDEALIVRQGQPYGFVEVVAGGCDAYLVDTGSGALRHEHAGTARLQGDVAQAFDAEGRLVAHGHWRPGAGAVTLLTPDGRPLGHVSTADLGDEWNDDQEEEQLLATAAGLLLLIG